MSLASSTPLPSRRRLGKSALVVSDICLGTMTFGSQADEKESHKIMDHCYERGIDFFDVAEIYPVPPKKEWIGLSEKIIGNWLKNRPRESMIIASKVTGPAHGWFQAPVRSGKCALDRHHIRQAIEGSLQRLQTDYLDLYQVHWADHGMRYEDTLSALGELVDEGKVRAIGCSNETSWGMMKSLWTSEAHGLPRYDTVQNNFSLINRRCENELAQVCRKEGVSLLPYSPIGGGVLSGKYNDGVTPQGARFSEYLRAGEPRQKAMAERFVNERSIAATQRFQAIAAELGVSVVSLALAWSKQHDYVASTIMGVSHFDQLEEVLAAQKLHLEEETLLKIDQVEEEIPNPMTEDGLRKL